MNNIKLLLAGFCIMLFVNATCKKNHVGQKEEITTMERVLIIPRGPDNPRNSECDFITLKDGRILLIYTHYTGNSYLDHAPAYLASRYSDDKGRTWTKESKMVVKQEGIFNVMSVSLLRLQNGEIALFYLKKDSHSECMPMVRFSSDEGKTWSEPQHCIKERKGYFILHNNRVIQLKDGRLVFSVAYSGKVCSYYSDDNGRTWKPGKDMPNPDGVVTQEPGIVELKNGDLFMIMRTDTTWQYASYSKDRGATWSPAAASNIISASQSPASISRIPSTGHLVLVWNNNTSYTRQLKANRTPLNIAISKDEGKSWEHIKTIEGNPSGSFCYTAIHYVDNHILLGYFDWATTQITITKLSKDWLYSN
jgi:Neuraminidase (sialidase)